MKHQPTYDCDLCGARDCGYFTDDSGQREVARVVYEAKGELHMCMSCENKIRSRWSNIVQFMKDLVTEPLTKSGKEVVLQMRDVVGQLAMPWCVKEGATNLEAKDSQYVRGHIQAYGKVMMYLHSLPPKTTSTETFQAQQLQETGMSNCDHTFVKTDRGNQCSGCGLVHNC